MPGVRPQPRRRGMVPGDGQHIRLEREQGRKNPIDRFNVAGLALEIAVLSQAVHLLDVNEEVVEFIPVRVGRLELVGWGLPFKLQHAHPNDVGYAPVHRVDGDRRSVQPI